MNEFITNAKNAWIGIVFCFVFLLTWRLFFNQCQCLLSPLGDVANANVANRGKEPAWDGSTHRDVVPWRSRFSREIRPAASTANPQGSPHDL